MLPRILPKMLPKCCPKCSPKCVTISLGYFILPKNTTGLPKVRQLAKNHPNWSPCFCKTRGLHYKTLQGSQGILKGEVSLYCKPPVWLVWYGMITDNFCFYLQNRLIQTSQTWSGLVNGAVCHFA
jgi:hypothetical protein